MHLRFSLFTLILCTLFFFSCKKNKDNPVSEVETVGASNITSGTVDITIRITAADGDSVSGAGVLVGLIPDPGAVGSPVLYGTNISPQGSGSYVVRVQVPRPGHTYHARAVIRARHGVSYGKDITFTISDNVGVTHTLPPLNIELSAVRLHSMDTPDVGAIYVERGFLYADHPFQDSFATYAGQSQDTLNDYTYNLTGLQMNTTYYVRSYCMVNEKMILGEEISFKTAGYSGPTGGFIIFDKGETTNGWRYLEAAPTDVKVGGITRFKWGCRGQALGAAGTDYGTGFENTNTIIAACPTAAAANAAKGYTAGGYTGWYLPATKEAFSIYSYLYQNNLLGSNTAYWTSTEAYSNLAIYMPSGFTRDKDSMLAVRAVRRY